MQGISNLNFLILKNKLTSLNHIIGLLGIFLYSFSFVTSTKASLISLECEKNKSYLIRANEFFDIANDSSKRFRTKFFSNLDEKSKIIKVNYDLTKGNAFINGDSAIVSSISKSYENFEQLPYKPVIIVSYKTSFDQNVTETITEESDTEKLIKTQVSTSIQEINKYFVLNTNNSNYSDFVFTETNVLTEGLIIKDADDIYDEDSEDIKNLYKVTTRICKLSENIDK